MVSVPRVAFFADSFHEMDGLGSTVREFEAFARRRDLPLFIVRTGLSTRALSAGSVSVLELQRGPASIDLDKDLRFDPFFWRYAWRVEHALRRWKPDVIHVTGPGDAGIMGAYAAYRQRIPLVASWHTNLHEVAARRLQQILSFVPSPYLDFAVGRTERNTFRGVALFYRIARVLLAPAPDVMDTLRRETGKPVWLMPRGVDPVTYRPSLRFRQDGSFILGFSGPLARGGNARFLVDVDRNLNNSNHRFLVIGDGPERPWLADNLRRAAFPGRLTGVALARAYAGMDLFLFPSRTDSLGNAIPEVLASGVPVVTAGGGQRFLIQSGVNGYAASTDEDFLWGVREILASPALHQRMREEARRSALEYSWDRVFERVYEAYSAALGASGTLKAAS
jgi:glycosyltransferase involved in cell wall biosynthesis